MVAACGGMAGDLDMRRPSEFRAPFSCAGTQRTTTMDQERLATVYLAEARHRLASSHRLVLHCIEQLTNAQLWWRPHESMNSVANLVLHVSGNLRQWIVSGVGSDADERDRPGEFGQRGTFNRAELIEHFDQAIHDADGILATLDTSMLLELRTIQGFEETVLGAIFESLTHLAGHAQEIVYVTRQQLGDCYEFQWVPGSPAEVSSPETSTANPLKSDKTS
jgi:hypothetical protein